MSLKQNLIIGGIVVLALASVGSLGYITGTQVGAARKELELQSGALAATIKKFNDNSDRVLAAGVRVVERGTVVEQHFHTAEKTIEQILVPLKSCPLSADAIRVWNNAAACAANPSAATCGVSDSVSVP